MTSVNDKILDALIDHDVDVKGYEQELIDLIERLIDKHGDKAISEIYDALSGRDPSTVTFTEIDALLSSVGVVGKALTVSLGKLIQKEIYGFLDNEVKFAMRLIDENTPIQVRLRSPSQRLINQVITRNPMQGNPIEEYIKPMGDNFTRVFREEIRQGLAEGKTVDQIVRSLSGTKSNNYKDGKLEIRKRGARSFVRTTLSHISNNASLEVYNENSDIVKKVKYVAVLDTRTTNFCKAHDNRVYNIDDKKKPKLPAHWNCRSRYTPVTKSWRELGIDIDDIDSGTRASMDGKVPQDTSYGDWLSRQSDERIEQALGATRAKLFKQGGLSVKELVNARGETLTLDELRKRNSQAFKKAGL